MEIIIEKLQKKYAKKEVLKDINITIDNKGVYAILGPNGSGKTTLLKSILGLVTPQKGNITLNQKTILNDWKYRKHVAYLPQIAHFPEQLKVSELFKLIESLRKEKGIHLDTLIEKFEMQSFLNQRVNTLSGGMKQKVNIVSGLMFETPIIILDEPTTGLDPLTVSTLKEIIFEEKKKGKTILLTSHIMSFVEEVSDELIFLLEGKVHVYSNISQLIKQYQKENLEQTLAQILKDYE
ncbi:iron-chelate-transporting ATPase [Flavobacteriaceae bacterium UJ101]|nr:iron-chelate-transporting ATPase [Flavobacteriaceae bacterium UJ101]